MDDEDWLALVARLEDAMAKVEFLSMLHEAREREIRLDRTVSSKRNEEYRRIVLMDKISNDLTEMIREIREEYGH